MTHSLRVRMRRWHRSAGALAAIGVLLLVVSGVLLNHAPSLGLDQRPVRSDWVLDRYGIQIDAPKQGYFVEPLWFSVCAGRLYADARPVAVLDRLAGVARLDDMIFAGGGELLVVLDAQGRKIDQLDPSMLPGVIEAIAVRNRQLLIEAGDQWYASDSSLLRWARTTAPDAPSGRDQLPEPMAQAIARDARGHQLHWERVLLDLHSGRLLGRWGPWVVDLFALLMALLAISGFWLWLRTRLR